MKFIDANVMIKAFTENDKKEKCRKILSDEFVTNTLCLVEAQHGITKIDGDSSYASRCIKTIYRSSGKIIDLDRNLLFDALKKTDSKLNIFDLVHYVSALRSDCTEIITYDKGFDSLDIQRSEP